MLIALIGPPSPLLERTRDVLCAIIRHKRGGVTTVAVTSANEVQTALQHRGPEPLILSVGVLTLEIAKLIEGARVSMIFVGDTLEHILAYTRKVYGQNELDALCYVSKVLAAAQPVALYKRTLKIQKRSGSSDRILILILIAFLGFTLTADEESVLKSFLPDREAFDPVVVPKSDLTADTIAATLQAFQGYNPIISGQSIKTMSWPRAIFHVPDPNAASTWEAGANFGYLTSQFDLTGPGRLLLFGPYLCLPVGRWRVIASYSVRGNQTGNTLQLDALIHPEHAAAAVLFEAQTDLPNDGNFVASFFITVTDPSAPIAIRTFLMRGSIDKGSLDFKGVEIERA
jgi:hypothetical protein